LHRLPGSIHSGQSLPDTPLETTSGCTRHSVEADFADDAWSTALLQAAFQPHMPTAWLAEGLLPYLQPSSVETLLRQLTGLSAAGSCLAADFVSADMMAARNAYVSQLKSPAVGALFNFGVNKPSVLLADYGWRVTSVKQPGDDDVSFGRSVVAEGVGAGFFFVMAERPFPSNPHEPRIA
jgi:methyltransferase (TIGR00027 family)